MVRHNEQDRKKEGPTNTNGRNLNSRIQATFREKLDIGHRYGVSCMSVLLLISME
jgi:hypothetical protein